MNAPADVNIGKRPRGRLDSDQQEAVIKLEPVRDRIETLVQLYNDSQVAAQEFGEAVKEVAEEAGLLAKSVRKFVVAVACEKVEEQKRQCEQLSLLFDEIEA